MDKIKIEGGFSKGVIESRELQSYINKGEPIFGYIGAPERTKRFDKALEVALREEGLDNEGIGCWLTSTSGRHCADELHREMTDSELNSMLKEWAKNAFVDVTIWNHPDHKGTLSSSEKLKDILKHKINI